MKSRCDMLVVGLTSDRLAASQKRPTIMDYDHRKAILDNCVVVHGDVHMRNLCMDTNGRLSLIDFGWCMWRGFDMTPAERALLQMRLDDRFDEAHFGRSLRDHGLCLSDGHVVEMVDADQQMVQASTEQSTVGT